MDGHTDYFPSEEDRLKENHIIKVNYDYELVIKKEIELSYRLEDVALLEEKLAESLLPLLFKKCAINDSPSKQIKKNIIGLETKPQDVIDKIGCSDKAIKKAASNNKRCVLVKGSMKIFSISNSTKTISNLSDEIQILIQNIMKHKNFPLHERMKINLDPDTFYFGCKLGDGLQIDPNMQNDPNVFSDQFLVSTLDEESKAVTVSYNYMLFSEQDRGISITDEISEIETKLAISLLPDLFGECISGKGRNNGRRMSSKSEIDYENQRGEIKRHRHLNDGSVYLGLDTLPKDEVDENGCSKVAAEEAISTNKICTFVTGSLTIFSMSDDTGLTSLITKEVMFLINEIAIENITWVPITASSETGSKLRKSTNSHRARQTTFIVIACVTVVGSLAIFLKYRREKKENETISWFSQSLAYKDSDPKQIVTQEEVI